MLRLLALLTLMLSASDHWTTYLCLRRPVDGFDVTEANPLAAWLFDSVGLVEGLAEVKGLAYLLSFPPNSNSPNAFWGASPECFGQLL